MHHFASYWQLFDHPGEPDVVTGWRIRSNSRLAGAERGDTLWLFTSGSKLSNKLNQDELPDGGVVASKAYLAEVFTIRGVIPEVDGRFELLVQGVERRCVPVRPAIIIDDIVRPAGWGEEKQVGSLRQGAWRLPDDAADQLEERLRREAPTVYRKVFR
jgi:hypothetical protein